MKKKNVEFTIFCLKHFKLGAACIKSKNVLNGYKRSLTATYIVKSADKAGCTDYRTLEPP